MGGFDVQALEFIARQVLPQPDGLVAAAGGEDAAAGGAEGGALDLIFVALQGGDLWREIGITKKQASGGCLDAAEEKTLGFATTWH
jgi:hypothetical protein